MELQSIASESAKHYENDAAFFASFLDPYMKYGSGYYVGSESFETAAVQMLDRSIDHALPQYKPQMRVLDVGSGWGAVPARLRHRNMDVEYHHINPSSVQREFIARAGLRVESVHAHGLERANLAPNSFDAIWVSDSFCHLSDKAEMLKKLSRALAPEGRLVLQDTFFLNDDTCRRALEARTTRFIQRDVFGYAELISLNAFTAQATLAGLQVRVLEDVSHSYLRTVNAWLYRLADVDSFRYPMKDDCRKYLVRAAACMGYTTAHYFCVMSKSGGTRQQLRDCLRGLRSSARFASA